MGDGAKQSEERPGLRGRLLSGAVLVLAPLLVLGAVEGVLRLAGYGGGADLIVPFRQVPGWLQVNPEVGRRWFADPEQAHMPAFEVFPARREPGDVRIVFQGASTGVGFPWGAHAAPARAVENRLRDVFPDRRIDVVNTSVTAVNSYALLDVAGEVAALRPDAVLIYAGHNEYYGVLGVGSARSVGRSRAVVLAYLRLSDLRIFQLLRAAVHALTAGEGDAAAPAPAGGETPMDRLAGDEGIPLGSELYRAGLEQYRRNLDDLLATYRAHGIPVLVATVASNERGLAPFLGGPAEDVDPAAWAALRERAAEALRRGDPAAARAAISGLIELDSLAADPWFLRGRLEEGVGAWDDARRSYAAARDRDQLRFRAPGEMNRIVREVAERHGARVVEVEEAFRAASPHGIVGGELLTEHVHPDLRGYAVLAHAFLEGLRAAGIPEGWDAAPPLEAPGPRPPLVTAVDSVLGRYRLTALLQGWPFRDRSEQEPLQVEPRTVADSLALRLYRRQALWIDVARDLAARQEAAGETKEAYRTVLAVAEEFPVVPHFFADAARLALELGRPEEAERLLRRARERGELPLVLRLEAVLMLRRGERGGAGELLRRAAAGGDERAAAMLDSLEAARGG